jgi:hypothetical protein
MFSVPYIPVESLSMQERVRTIESVLSLAGVSEVAAAERLRARNGNGHELVRN